MKKSFHFNNITLNYKILDCGNEIMVHHLKKKKLKIKFWFL